MKEEKSKPAVVVNKDVTRTRTPTVNIYRPPAARFAETKSSTTVADDIQVKDARRSRVRRPDQQVYVPRPKRASLGGPVPDSNSDKGSQRRVVNDPMLKYIEKQKRSIKLHQEEENIDGSYRNSVHEDSSSFSEDNSSLSSCETSSTNLAVTDLHDNVIQNRLPHSDDVTITSSCKHLALNNTLGDNSCNDVSEKSVGDLEENKVLITQLSRSLDYRNDKFNDCEYLNSSYNDNRGSSTDSSSSISRGQQNCSFGCDADEVKIFALHTRAQEYDNCEFQKKEQIEIIVIEEDTVSVGDSQETVEQNVGKETNGNCQSMNADGFAISDIEIDRDVVKSGDMSFNVSSRQTSEIIETDNLLSSSENQKNYINSVEKSNCEDCNLKNRRILHSFPPVSDVLFISEPVEDNIMIKSEVSNENSVETVNSETKIDNKLSSNKVNSCNDKCKNKKISKTVETMVTTTTTAVSVNKDECDWESMFTEDGECLVPGLIEELTRNVGRVKVASAASDYRSYQSSDERSSDGECIIEIYDFPAEFKSQDLLTIFAAYRNRSFQLKWVDDTHALGIFSSPVVADEVLALDLPFVKTRPLRLGIAESKIKARNLILPPMERPKTCTAMARRLVTGALGLRLPSASKEREAERKVLSEAREKRRQEAKQREAIWEGLT